MCSHNVEHYLICLLLQRLIFITKHNYHRILLGGINMVGKRYKRIETRHTKTIETTSVILIELSIILQMSNRLLQLH